MPSSQVRLVDAYASYAPPANTSAAAAAVALAVSSGCSIPLSPAKPQQLQFTGVTTSTAMADAMAARSGSIPSWVDEQVGCTTIEPIGSVTLSAGSSCSLA